MPKVVITEGPGTGTEYRIEKAAILGRLESNAVPIKDGKASREHAKIFQQGQDYAIVDLNSSNGTYVNGQRITRRVLKAGDEIAIGTVKLRYELLEEDKPKAPTTAKRKTLEEALDKARQTEAEKRPGPAGGAKGAPELELRSFKPLQYSRIAPGRPLLGFDLDQMSDTARLIVWLVAIGFFALILYLVYNLVVGS